MATRIGTWSTVIRSAETTLVLKRIGVGSSLLCRAAPALERSQARQPNSIEVEHIRAAAPCRWPREGSPAGVKANHGHVRCTRLAGIPRPAEGTHNRRTIHVLATLTGHAWRHGRGRTMTFAWELSEAAYREGERWCLSVCAEWIEQGWSLPERWPFTIRQARGVIGLASDVNPAITMWLAAVTDAAARLAWARVRTSLMSTAHRRRYRRPRHRDFAQTSRNGPRRAC